MFRSACKDSGQARRAWEVAANVVVASFFVFFAYSCARGFLESLRVSILLVVVKESLDAFFFLCRRLPKQVTSQPVCWITAIAGTVAPLMLRPAGSADYLPGELMQYAGLCLQIIAIFSLNRSFGIVPANRGVQRNGLYRLVRHPLYSSYTIALTGFVINNFTWQNLALLLITTGLQIVRIFREEELLSLDIEYRDYSRITRWKMIPFLF